MCQILWESNSLSGCQEIPNFLWNPKFHYRVYKILPPVSILSQMCLVYNIPSCFPKIHSNIILPSTPKSYEWFFLSGFHSKILHAFLFYTLPTCPADLTLLDLIALIIVLHESYKLRNSPSYILLQPPVTSFFLGPNVLRISLSWERCINVYQIPLVFLVKEAEQKFYRCLRQSSLYVINCIPVSDLLYLRIYTRGTSQAQCFIFLEDNFNTWHFGKCQRK
jgi:hypothetical protein